MQLAHARSIAIIPRRSRWDYDLTLGLLPDVITVARDSPSNRFDSNGLLDSVPANQAVFEYSLLTLACLGLRIEPQKTNLLDYSTPAAGWNLYNCIDAGTTPVVPGKATPGSVIELTDAASGNSGSSHGATVTQTSIMSGAVFVKGIGPSIGKIATFLMASFPGVEWFSGGDFVLTAEPKRLFGISPIQAEPGQYALVGVGNYSAFGGASNLVDGDQIGIDFGMLEYGYPTSPVETNGIPETRDADVVYLLDTSRATEVTWSPLDGSPLRRSFFPAGVQPAGIYGYWKRIRQL